MTLTFKAYTWSRIYFHYIFALKDGKPSLLKIIINVIHINKNKWIIFQIVINIRKGGAEQEASA